MGDRPVNYTDCFKRQLSRWRHEYELAADGAPWEETGRLKLRSDKIKAFVRLLKKIEDLPNPVDGLAPLPGKLGLAYPSILMLKRHGFTACYLADNKKKLEGLIVFEEKLDPDTLVRRLTKALNSEGRCP